MIWIIQKLWRGMAIVMLLQKCWKLWLVRRFFARPIPQQQREPHLVSIMQPILSGDPTLRDCLAANLAMHTRYHHEFLWLIDDDDPTAHEICHELVVAFPQKHVHIISLPAPAERTNPKTFKLNAGLNHARGDVICVLDDDTRLPDAGLEQCLPFLDQPQVGLAFGLPYYRYFGNLWSTLVTLFVNDQSLLTYVPYTALTQPFTINGMFYAIRRAVLDDVGGFRGIEHVLADDFAVASRLREHGYTLAQTPLRHAISTHVRDHRHYLSLIQRWFIFPRESLLRHLGWRDQAIVYGLGALPATFPLVVVLSALIKPSRSTVGYAIGYFGVSMAAFRWLDQAYLHATPNHYTWLVPLVEAIFPLQLIAALFAPQTINWRGHVMQIEHGGGFHFVQRRANSG